MKKGDLKFPDRDFLDRKENNYPVNNREMKTWYVYTTVQYKAQDNGDTIEDTESFPFIIQSWTESTAKKQAEAEAIKALMIGIDCIVSIAVTIDDIYETSDDARL